MIANPRNNGTLFALPVAAGKKEEGAE